MTGVEVRERWKGVMTDRDAAYQSPVSYCGSPLKKCMYNRMIKRMLFDHAAAAESADLLFKLA